MAKRAATATRRKKATKKPKKPTAATPKRARALPANEPPRRGKSAKRATGATRAPTTAKKPAAAQKKSAKKATTSKKKTAPRGIAQAARAERATGAPKAAKRAGRAANAKSKAAPPAKKRPAAQAAAKGRALAAASRRIVLRSFEQVQHFSAPPERIYRAWLDGDQHAAFTGARATGDASVGATFTAWDGYISGTHAELTPGERILQSWRARDFPASYPDSVLELRLVPESGGTRLHLRHIGVPAANALDYERGWHERYWQPLRAWLATHAGGSPLD